MENEGMFLETNVYNGNNSRYGTPRPEVERIIKEGKSPILEIDVHGREQVAEWILDHPEHSLQSIFIFDSADHPEEKADRPRRCTCIHRTAAEGGSRGSEVGRTLRCSCSQ